MENEAQHLQKVYQTLLVAESELSQFIEEKSQTGRTSLQKWQGKYG